MTEPEHNVAASACDHAYEVRLLGGHPLSVRLCTLCRTPDWADLYEQADALFRWGREEGLAGKPPRAKLSAYDRPTESDPEQERTHQGPGVYGGLETHRGARHECPAPDCGPQGVRVVPNRPDVAEGVTIHFPEVDYVDTQPWSADVGVSTDALRELRDAIDTHLAAEATTVDKPAATESALREWLPVLRRAVETLPAKCRYHDETHPHGTWREACCDTGIPARRRALAEEALNALTKDETA